MTVVRILEEHRRELITRRNKHEYSPLLSVTRERTYCKACRSPLRVADSTFIKVASSSKDPASFKQRAMLVDEIWHGAGDEGNEIDWYVKRTVLGWVHSATEIYMLTDNSPDYHDTWAFLNARVRDAFDLSLQEVKYLAEAVGAGMGTSLQGFTKRAC